MADLKTKYGSSGQSITITLDSLNDDTMRQSTEVDNSTDLFIDVLIAGKVTTGAAPSADRSIPIYAFATADNGTTRTGDAGATDAAFSGNEDVLILVGVIPTGNGANETYYFGPFSLRAAFGGTIPEKWGLVFKNDTGDTLNATTANHAVHYQGQHFESS